MRIRSFSQRTIQYLSVTMFALSIFMAPAVYAENIITTFAGIFDDFGGYEGDGGPAKLAPLSDPFDVAVDNFGNVYISDNDISLIRKVDKTGIITTVVGIPWYASQRDCGDNYGDGGPATSACLEWPRGVTLDAHGNLFIADVMHGRIRKVDKDGIISTVAGSSFDITEHESSGDGGAATEAKLCWSQSIAVDSKGNIFIAGEDEAIRKVDTDGIITTVAGTHGVEGYSGDGGPATSALLGHFNTVAVDANDNLYIADAGNSSIRKVDTDGIITTFAGTPGVEGYSGDGGAATSAQLMYPCGLALGDSGKTLYIADPLAPVIRKVRIGVTKRPVRCGCDICFEYPSE